MGALDANGLRVSRCGKVHKQVVYFKHEVLGGAGVVVPREEQWHLAWVLVTIYGELSFHAAVEKEWWMVVYN